MIVWAGRGILALLFPLLSLGIGFLIPLHEYRAEILPLSISLGGLLTWYLGSKWNKIEIYFDPEDQQYYKRENDHTLYWIPMHYIGLGIMFIGATSLLGINLWVGIPLVLIYIYIVGYGYFKKKGLGIPRAKINQRPMSRQEAERNIPPALPSNNWESRR